MGHFGPVSRLAISSTRGGPDPVINVFAEKGEAQVICYLSNREPISRCRRARVTERRIGSRSALDDRSIIDHAVATKAPSSEARLGIGRLRDLFRGSHILSQHNIRQFLEQTQPAQRFDILTNMIGAEEFVRFREKLATVVRHISSHIAVISEKDKSLGSALAEVSTKLHENMNDFQSLREAVTDGVDPANLCSEILQGLRNCQCAVDDAAIEKADSGAAEQRFQLIGVYAESAIHDKKAAIEDLYVRLDSLEKESHTYMQSRTRSQSLRAEIESAKGASESGRRELQNEQNARNDIVTRLQIVRTRQTDAARHYIDLTWLKENLSAYREGCEALKRTEASLSSQRDEIQKAEVALEKQESSLSTERSLYMTIEKKIDERVKRDQILCNLLKRLSEVRARWYDLTQLNEKEKWHESRMAELKQQASSARDEVNVVQTLFAKLKTAYNLEASRYDVLSSFLAKLAELVRSAECPLCGRRFHSHEEAKNIIQERLSAVPEILKNLAHKIDDTKKSLGTKQANFNSVVARLETLEVELKEARTNRDVATRAVKEFLAECARLSITASSEDPASWQPSIEEARKECEVASLALEAARLRDSINQLSSSITEQQSVISRLRQKAIQDEKQRKRLAAMVEGFKSDMLKRGLQPGSLLEGECLNAQIAKARTESEKCNESVSKSEAELRRIDSAIIGHRNSLKRIDEDAASKEKQLHQYESICANFIASSQIAGVDPENPIEHPLR
jgi:chromosome segregation ATPase